MNKKINELNQGAFSQFPRTSILKTLIMKSWFLHVTSTTELSLDITKCLENLFKIAESLYGKI